MIGKLDIIIANNSNTKSVNVPFKDTEPVYYILERVRSKLGASKEDITRQDLYVNGKLIEDQQKSIGYYRIFGRTLTYRALDNVVFKIEVKTLTGRLYTFPNCHRLFRISDMKALIEPLERCRPEMQRIIFAGTQLEDEKTLQDYNIYEDTMFHLVLRLRGGGGGIIPGIVFSDVSNSSNVRKVKFSDRAPPGRIASPGTNVECNCACTPSHQVICAKKFGSLELVDTTFVCPNCGRHDRIVPVTVGFMSCKYRFHGIKGTGEQYTSNWVDVKERDCYQLFEADKSTVWRRLVIESVDRHACEECTICLEPLENFETLGCGHCFHTACIADWNGSCPNCGFNKHLTTGFS
ncbi:hypothetical protein K457DRAFT_1885322 [Linnemannia elongata AG-77]|uniref:Ubiquitin-domain-containing protein n=1 Tax=Linnemannia elongata AG-77 TaxID=1314771 RepID=A0A197JEX3_9FUNG|nr:hypothetical protein K457DRAFT_1885322 [Linnemannia elongata AG-77]